MDVRQLANTAKALVAPGKGILAADESGGTIKRRFDSINAESIEENRRNYREMLSFAPTAPPSTSAASSSTTRPSARTVPMARRWSRWLADQGVIPGIKVDKGTKPLLGAPDELVTEGLDGLADRLKEYFEIGARFTKWRGVITIGPDIPSAYCLDVNAHALACYATLSQEAGLVPIVEPEVLMDGDHDIDTCLEVTEATLREVFYQLGRQGVVLEGMLLKPNMVISGASAADRAGPQEVAEKTIACFKRTVPAAVPGIVFLSGGQSDAEATVNLDAINRRAEAGAPWELSFSYGRGLQAAPLKAWSGKAENVARAQLAYYQRARFTSAARQGAYSPEMEKEVAAT